MELKMKYISELLFENDCVIIPGLGALWLPISLPG